MIGKPKVTPSAAGQGKAEVEVKLQTRRNMVHVQGNTINRKY
jgi:hypothetical protein